MRSDEIIIGIDLGFRNTQVAMASRENNNNIVTYEVLSNSTGHRTTPSMVTFTDNEVVVGSHSKGMQMQYPEQTIYGMKGLLGRKFSDPYVQNFKKHVPFKIVADGNDLPLIEVTINGQVTQFSPEEICSKVLEEAARMALNRAGKPIDKYIITVPACFNELQRSATLRAAQIANLDCIQILDEPTAAAIALQHCTDYEDGTILLYDFGAGSLDVCILEVKNGQEFNVKAVAGNSSLGGEDIDAKLMDYVIQEFNQENPTADPSARALAALKQECEECKKQLSSCETVHLSIPSFIHGTDLDISITRPTFKYICEDITEELLEPISNALDMANLNPSDITQVILLGGSSCIPFVSEKISELFDCSVRQLVAVNPDHVIALGAALKN